MLEAYGAADISDDLDSVQSPDAVVDADTGGTTILRPLFPP